MSDQPLDPNAATSETASDAVPDTIRAMIWDDDRLYLLDQRGLPHSETWLTLDDAQVVAHAIHDMVVRGAPAIGITAAYGAVLAARAAWLTAVNLHWALARLQRRFPEIEGDPEPVLLAEARAIHDEDIVANRRMGESGAGVIGPCDAVLTHCNTGSLATGGFGTALGVARTLYGHGDIRQVYVTETRPWLQGARLTAWELARDAIPATLLADSAAAALFGQGRVQWVIVGADRIAANGDVANKIGTYALALAARHHGVGFMVVAPTSTVDLDTPAGSEIVIEDRGPAELLTLGGQATAADGTDAWNPVFDITPAGLVDVLVTEKDVLERPDTVSLAQLMQS